MVCARLFAKLDSVYVVVDAGAHCFGKEGIVLGL